MSCSYRIIRLRKSNGEFRTIYVPADEETKQVLKYYLSWTDPLAHDRSRPLWNTVHGFLKKHSPITNARWHTSYKHTLSMDFKDWFNTVTPARALTDWHSTFIRGNIPAIFPGGSAKQGLCTSPSLANLDCYGLDYKIAMLKLSCGFFVYTRYADDLTFSSDSLEQLRDIKSKVVKLTEEWGYKINHRKTRWQHANQGRRMITGVAVDDKLHPSRKLKRKIRAAQHQNNTASARGMLEQEKLRRPKLGIPCLDTTFPCDCNNRKEFDRSLREYSVKVNSLPICDIL